MTKKLKLYWNKWNEAIVVENGIPRCVARVIRERSGRWIARTGQSRAFLVEGFWRLRSDAKRAVECERVARRCKEILAELIDNPYLARDFAQRIREEFGL